MFLFINRYLFTVSGMQTIDLLSFQTEVSFPSVTRDNMHTLSHAGTLAHMHICQFLSVPAPHTVLAHSRVQTSACIWNQEWIHITCVVCCLSGSGSSIMNRNIQPPQPQPWCLSTCKGFFKRGTGVQVCHLDAYPGLMRPTLRRYPVLSQVPAGELPSVII